MIINGKDIDFLNQSELVELAEQCGSPSEESFEETIDRMDADYDIRVRYVVAIRERFYELEAQCRAI